MPFITSTLQQEASTKLNFGAKKTMQIAQKLYEGLPLADGVSEGLISYMRTDSTRLSDVFVKDAESYIEEVYGKEYNCLLYTSDSRDFGPFKRSQIKGKDALVIFPFHKIHIPK